MDRVVAHELRIIGSHGMQAHRYDELLGLITSGRLDPSKLVGRTISLEHAVEALVTMDRPGSPAVTVVSAAQASSSARCADGPD